LNKEPDWSDSANCKGHTEDFYAIHTPSARRGKRSIMIKVTAICESCNVTGECLVYACNTKQEYGVWATFTPEQIKKISNQSINLTEAKFLVQANINKIKETFNV
jgi:hypothetical protein